MFGKIKKKTVPIEKHNQLKRWYTEEIKKRDAAIEELMEKNKMLIASALKESERRLEISKHAKELLDITKKLKEKRVY